MQKVIDFINDHLILLETLLLAVAVFGDILNETRITLYLAAGVLATRVLWIFVVPFLVQ